METSIPHVREILIFLAAAGILVPLFQKFKISPILGFLISGLMLGPYGAGLLANIWEPARAVVITESEGVHALAEMGIVFLLFMIGLELSFERLSSMRRLVFGLGAAQVIVTAIIIGLIARAFGNSPEGAMVLGVGFALSSTAIVLQLLAEQKRMGSSVGRASFAILLFQDLSVVFLLFIFGFIGADTAGESSESLYMYFAKALGSAAISIVVIITFGRVAFRPIFKLVGKSHNKELFMATTLLAVIGIAVGTEMAGLSMALGAFLAGLLLAETEYRHDIEITIEPFKGLLLGLFFMSVGMGMDIREIFNDPFWIIASVAGLFILKAAIIYPIAVTMGMQRGRAIELGLLLGQGGEFAFVVLAMATANNMIESNTTQFMLIVTSLSMMLTPLVARVGYRIKLAIDGQETSPYGPAAAMVDAIDNHVVMAGYGRMGRLLNDILTQQQIPAVAIEQSPLSIFSNRVPILQGDAADHDTLIKAGIRRAIAVAVLIDKSEDAKRVVEAVKELNPRILIVARARDADHAVDLYRLGATATIPDVIEGSLHVAQELLKHIGVPEDAARHIIDQQRAHEVHLIESALKQ